jgi:hypothetical protein
MQFWTPLKAHADWISRLREQVYGSDAPLSVSEVADFHDCALGRWLADEGSRYRDVPEYAAAQSAHADFHRRAALVVALSASGLRAEAIAELEDGGGLRRSSRALVRAVQAFRRRVAALDPR